MRFLRDRPPVVPEVREHPVIQAQQGAEVVARLAAVLPRVQHVAPLGQEGGEVLPYTHGNRGMAIRHHGVLLMTPSERTGYDMDGLGHPPGARAAVRGLHSRPCYARAVPLC
jgi:hypothetical protein